MAVTLSIFDQFDTRRTSISGSTVGRKTRQFDLPEAPCSSPAWVCFDCPGRRRTQRFDRHHPWKGNECGPRWTAGIGAELNSATS